MEELLRHILLVVLKACLCLLPMIVACWLASLGLKHGVNPLDRLMAFMRSLPPAGRFLVGGWLIICVLWGSEKNPTNSPPMMMGAPRLLQSGAPAQYVPEGEFGLAEPMAPPPEGAVTNTRWLARGAFEDAVRLPLPGDGFTWRDGVITGLTVFASGEFRPYSDTPYFPPPFEEGLSLPPRSRAADGGGVFWYGSTVSNSLLVTWEGAFRGRDDALPTDFQAEFYEDGSFDYRYENYVCRYPPSYPFDYDNDGLENSVDPQPLVPGPDAHGTCAEWYNALFGGILSAVDADGGVDLSWNEGGNSNAYYFVDVEVSAGPAPVCFFDVNGRCGDDPVLVANPGTTNKVPLVIGPLYMVTSSVPFTVTVSGSSPGRHASPDVVHIEHVEGEYGYKVRWPIEFGFEEDPDDQNSYTMGVSPLGLDISYSWSVSSGRSQAPMHLPLALGAGSSGCQCFRFEGSNVTVCCSSSCDCGGCTLGGSAYHIGHPLEIPSIHCGCRPPEDDDGHEDEENPTPSEPCVSAYFTGRAVIYEDAYVTPTGEDANMSVSAQNVGKRSSQVELVIRADGGSNGGKYSITVENIGKLAPVASGPAGSRYAGSIGAGQSIAEYYTFEGAEPSGDIGDVSISGKITDNSTGDIYYCPVGRLTVFKIKLSPKLQPPYNAYSMRHVYGVNEPIKYEQWPGFPLLTTQVRNIDDELIYNCSLLPCENPLTVSYLGVNYTPLLLVIAPESLKANNPYVVKYTNVADTSAGGVGLVQELYVRPTYVSFSQIAVEEVPSEGSSRSGYFSLPTVEYLLRQKSHTRDAGAGEWFDVNLNGRIGGQVLMEDTAAIKSELPRVTFDGVVTTNATCGWRNGEMIWDIPMGWNIVGTRSGPPVQNFATGQFEIKARARFSSATARGFAIAREGCLGGLQRGS